MERHLQAQPNELSNEVDMKQTLPEIVPGPNRARIARIAFLLLFTLGASWTASAQAPTWTANDAYQAYTSYTSPEYFFDGPNTYTKWSDPNGNGDRYSIIVDQKGDKAWHTFWQEAEKIELAEDAYYWADKKKDDRLKSAYREQVNQLCQGFIDKMWPDSNFGKGTPWSDRGDPYNWHGADFKDTNYSSQHNPNAKSSGPGDWFNDDLMWAAIAFARAYQITGTKGWLEAAENQVDYVWANAQAHTNADGTVVGLLQTFCNKNGGKDGDCEPSSASPAPAVTASAPHWAPNLDAEVNFTFVIAADLLAHNTTVKSKHYQDARDAVYAWTMANLYSETSKKAKDCSQAQTKAQGHTVTCAEIFDNNNAGPFNGENGHWSKYEKSATPSDWDFTMNYGNAIQAAVRMGDKQKAQNIANYLMYGLSNPRHPYVGVYHWDASTSYNILPYYGPEQRADINGVPTLVPADYDEGSNYAGSNGIALRGVAYGLSRGALDKPTREWAQANVQAAWNNKNPDNVIWDDWAPGHITGKYRYPSVKKDYVYDSWDCSDAVAGLLTVPPHELK
jgi:hypothetical protein